LRAAILDVAADRLVGEVERADQRSRIDRLADSAGLDIIRTLGRVPTGGIVRYGSLRVGSVAALKEFLRGEQEYRRGRWDSALAHFGMAARIDTTFVLANRRMFKVLGWEPYSAGQYERASVYLRRAVAMNRGLSTKDSILIVVDSIAEAESGQSFGSEYHRFFGTLEMLVQRFPDDPEVWQVVGEGRFHYGLPSQGSWRASMEAFQRAIDLDPEFAPAYVHMPELAVRLQVPARARELARVYLALTPTDRSADAIRLASLMLDPSSAPAARASALESASAVSAIQAAQILNHWADTGETALGLARGVATGTGHRMEGAPRYVRDTTPRALRLAAEFALRGHLAAADSVIERIAFEAHQQARGQVGRTTAWLPAGLLRGSATEATELGLRASLAGDFVWYDGGREALAWWGARADTVAIVGFADRAGRFARSTGPREPDAAPWSRGHAGYLVRLADAYLMLARGDSAGALHRLRALPDSMCIFASCFHERMLTGRLLAARGSLRDAAGLMDAWSETGPLNALYVLSRLERARLAERLGDPDAARRWYGFVAAMWARGDREVQPYVMEATAALRRLDAATRRR
jgi:tetratricopeptide (TPR) repeat protein